MKGPGTSPRRPGEAPDPAVPESSRLYDRSFAFATVNQTCFVLANMLMAHYARWVSFLGGDVGDVGWILGGGSVAGLFLRPWIGQWINRLGARTTWALGYAIFAACALGNLALDELGWEIYVLRAGLILGAAFVFASGLTYVSQTAPLERRTEAIGVLGAGGFVGMLFGPYLGDVILGSGPRSREDFDTLFIGAAALLVLPALLLFFIRAPSGQGPGAPVRVRDFVGTVRRHWPGTILLVIAVFGVCVTVPFSFLADYVDQERLAPAGGSAVGIFFLGYAGWGLTLRLLSRRVPDRFGRRKVLLAGMTFMGGGMFAFFFVGPGQPAWIILPGLICGTGHALMFHTMTALALEKFPVPVRGSGSALSLMMLDLGTVGGAPLLGALADALGYSALFVTVGSACLVAALVYTCSSIPVWRSRRPTRGPG